ncbi:MAG: DUF1549 and DUF1553 domain-containing protein [Bryobacteraceae bacterium]
MNRGVAVLVVCAPLATGHPPDPDSFESRIRPVLVNRCGDCHNAKLRMAGIDLTSAEGFRSGPGNGRILDALTYTGKIKMPPSGKLNDSELSALTAWIRAGAAWPKSTAVRTTGRWWAFEPVASTPGISIDGLWKGALEQAGLAAAPDADKLTLLRRATFDLTGLPPTESEIHEFLADGSAEAFAKVIDRLLASPRYGEHWGRHWLDVARYADSTGADEDHRYPHAWRYRDYVIGAFNRDLPYDRFVREQIAGDLLPAPGDGEVNVDGIVATGFLALGPKLIAEQDKVKMFYDIVDEQIDVTGRAFLGLTIACARCHDHKFDPVTTKDYYALAGIFASTKQLAKLEGTVSKLYFAPLVPKSVAAQFDEHQKLVEDKQKEIDALAAKESARYREALVPRLAAYLLAARGFGAGDGLDAKVLARFTEYLKPNGERRPHLEAIQHAGAAEAPAVARRFQEQFEAEIERRRAKQEKVFAGDNRFYTEVVATAGPFGIRKEDREAVYAAESKAKLAILETELAALKKAAPPEPPMACAVGEDTPVEQHVFVRGNPASKGDLVPKRVPEVLAGPDAPAIVAGSGRRELANWIASPGNPLTARVMVNRIWQWHFGEGLVRTPSNYGKLGEKPTHPELLDHLAAEFVRQGWSVKSMHRLIMLSAPYRLSSAAPAAAREKDPENRLLAHFPRRRLTVEELRDSMLFLDNSLDLAMGGTYQEGAGTDKEFSDDRKSINPDTVPRRLVYLPLRRSNLPSLLNLFDFGDATTTGEGRTQTNVAPQALFMMNSPFVERRAATLAAMLGADIERAWLRILNRKPEQEDIHAARAYVRAFPGPPELAWKSYYRTLLASNEFLYVQ